MTHTIKSVDLANGINIEYVEQGEPSGTPVLFLHGVTDSWRSFEPVLPHLPASIHAYALSQRGHGDSTSPAAGYSFRDFASDVVAFMDALNIKGAVIVGHSMGSYVAQRFAMDHPERTLGLVLIGSFASMRGNAGVDEFRDTCIKNISDPVDPSLARDFQQSTLAQPVPAEFFEMVVAESLKVKARVWFATFEEFRVADFSGELGKIKAPTLIVWGGKDSFCLRSDQEALVSGIRNAQLIVYADAGHATHWEEPERVAADIVTFIESRALKSNRAPGAR